MFVGPRRPCAAVALLALAWAGLVAVSFPAAAGELVQYFPAVPDGNPAPRPESGWKISWLVRQPGTHDYGGSAVWELRDIRFMRGYNADGSEDWVNVLNRLAMAEMYVPYHEGTYFLDISGGMVGGDGKLQPFHFPLIKASENFLPKYGVIRATLHEDQYVISEVVDDHVRWMDNRSRNEVRRGQTMHLWATLFSGNYRYLLRYSFADDGTISVRVGGTAENYFSLGADGSGDDHATHIHMAAWRMEFHLGDPEKNKIESVQRKVNLVTKQPSLERKLFKGGREGGMVWDPAQFSMLKITSGVTLNRHDPPRNIAYVLRPVRTGTVRTRFDFTKYDFWVTRLKPDSPNRAVDETGVELRFIDVPKNVKNAEPIDGKAVVIWHTSGLNHIPRTEDFGTRGYRSQDGVAVAAWTGFDLVPVDLWHQTPFLNRVPLPVSARPQGPG
jgi:Cu2+-containing amine oxidase